MIQTEIKFLSILSDLIDTNELVLDLKENSTIRELISVLEDRVGEQFKKRILSENRELTNYVILVINGKDIRSLNGFETKIQDKDMISFLPALAGG